jgi:RNA recognition motif-containing protein
MSAGANAHFKCFIGNLSHSADEQQLKKALEHIESFAGVKVMYDKFDGKPRGFGWAYFNDMAGMKAAHALSNRVLIHGRAILIQPPREASGGGDESGAPPPKKRKAHKPIQGAIEIAHAQYADMDRSAYQQARASQRRVRPVDEPAAADIQSGLLLPQTASPAQPAARPAQPMAVKLTVRAKSKPNGTKPSDAPGAPAADARIAAPAAAAQTDRPSVSAPTGAIALLQSYGDSDDADDGSEEQAAK